MKLINNLKIMGGALLVATTVLTSSCDFLDIVPVEQEGELFYQLHLLLDQCGAHVSLSLYQHRLPACPLFMVLQALHFVPLCHHFCPKR